MAGGSSSLRLRQAIVLNDLPLVRRLLRANPSCLYNPDFNDKSNTSLHIAAQHGLVEIVDYLISLGHDKPNLLVEEDICNTVCNNQGTSVNTDGHTALHLAATNLHPLVVELLCHNFPTTIDRPDKEGCTALLLAAKAQPKALTPNTLKSPKPMIRAAEDTSTIQSLLSYGAAIDAQDVKGNTCLHYACAWGNLKTIRALVQAGADPLQTNFTGWKPEFYSLTVQAEVYFRNLVAEFEKYRAEERRIADERKSKGGGSVRLVADDEDEDDDDIDDDASDSVESYDGRKRAGSSRSETTTESSIS